LLCLTSNLICYFNYITTVAIALLFQVTELLYRFIYLIILNEKLIVYLHCNK